MITKPATPDTLNSLVQFDSPFRVNADGTVTQPLSDVYAPTVMNDDTADIEIDSDDWTALTGYTGQYGYGGAVMHPSEYLAGGMARVILETPGIYVVTEVIDPDDDDGDHDPIGWCLLKLN